MSIAGVPPQPLRAACFDLDGTLIDTGPLHFEAERLALAALGVPETAPDHPVTFGAGIMPGMQMLADHYGIGTAERVLEAYLPAWESIFDRGLRPMPGADSALRAMHAAGVPMALMTSGEAEYVEKVLDLFDWSDLFSHLVTLESVERLKPDPEPYLLAAKLLGLQPGLCAGFEDSPSGLTALKAAGMFSVIVRPDSDERQWRANPDVELTSLENLTEMLISRMFRR